MEKYEIILCWSKEDQVFVAEVPELLGCMAHGETQNEAFQSIQEAMSFWLDTARELGRTIPEPRGRLMYA